MGLICCKSEKVVAGLLKYDSRVIFPFF